ncbi:MAG: glycosyltransferase family 4 protein [Pseudomonadota bacterium]
MKVLHLNTSDTEGGAARLTNRIVEGLRRLGVDCSMLVNSKRSDDPAVIGPTSVLEKGVASFRHFIDLLPVRFYPHRMGNMFPEWVPDRLARKVREIDPDIIHLHWLLGGFLRIETLAKFGRPIVWTMHDMWAITGGCAYTGDCKKYLEQCGACPQLGSSKERDLTHRVLKRKRRAWKDLDITLVTHGSWLVEAARHSALFSDSRIEMVVGGLDTDRYLPIEKPIARKILGLPLDKHLVLFGTLFFSEPNKGFHLLQPALQKLLRSEWKKNIELVVFGASGTCQPLDLGTPCHFLGKLHDDHSLALAYSAADVFVAPSMQDVGPQTVAEAMACGTPCVGFNIGGLPDRIDHEKNGYLARPFEIDDFARGIAWTLENLERHKQLCKLAREKAVREFGLERQAKAYLDIYESILGKSH